MNDIDINMKTQPDHYQSGRVMSVKKDVIKIDGLYNVEYDSLVHVGHENNLALIIHIDIAYVVATILHLHQPIKENDVVRSYNKKLQVPVGRELIGRIVDPLGNPLDEGLSIETEHYDFIEKYACPMMSRVAIKRPLLTGIKLIDYLLPIGRGQRELILGNKATGKTQMAIDAIINQHNTGVKCVYVAIGQPQIKINRTIQKLKEHHCMDYTTVIVSRSDDFSMFNIIAPYAGTTIAEYFMERGEDALIIYDDLLRFAWSKRELSLYLGETPGRESYPGHLFYSFARLLERPACAGAKYVADKTKNQINKPGSLSAIPILEIQEDDITSYVATSLVSITDGQIVLKNDLFNKNIIPAIDVGLSVSRVGSAARSHLMSHLVKNLKFSLSQYRELEQIQLLSPDMTQQNRALLHFGAICVELLKQEPNAPLCYQDQIITLFILKSDIVQDLTVKQARSFECFAHSFIKEQYKPLYKELKLAQFSQDLLQQFNKIIRSAFVVFNAHKGE